MSRPRGQVRLRLKDTHWVWQLSSLLVTGEDNLNWEWVG